MNKHDMMFFKALIFTAFSEKELSDIESFSDKVDKKYKVLKDNSKSEANHYRYNRDIHGGL